MIQYMYSQPVPRTCIHTLLKDLYWTSWPLNDRRTLGYKMDSKLFFWAIGRCTLKHVGLLSLLAFRNFIICHIKCLKVLTPPPPPMPPKVNSTSGFPEEFFFSNDYTLKDNICSLDFATELLFFVNCKTANWERASRLWTYSNSIRHALL